MNGRITRSTALVSVLLALACSQPAPEADTAAADKASAPAAITQEELTAISQSQQAALNAGDAAGAAAPFTADAMFLNARGKFETQQAIQAFWTEALKNDAGKNLKLEVIKSHVSGDMAYSISRFTGGITAPSGHTLAVMQRQADGSVKILATVSLPDPPAK